LDEEAACVEGGGGCLPVAFLKIKLEKEQMLGLVEFGRLRIHKSYILLL
jgi:hypothetical protein